MADFKLNKTGAEIQDAINRALVATVTEELSTNEYNALTNRDPKTLYIITDDESEGDLSGRISDLDARMTDVGLLLDEINGEVV